MNINSDKVKQLRKQNGWSQEQLSELCGVNLRTIQRIEVRGTASPESAKALAAVFSVPLESLLQEPKPAAARAITSIKSTIMDFDDFQSRSGRFEYWWFFVFFVLVIALAENFHTVLASAFAIVLLVPFLAVSTRRLRDAGYSPWWQWMYLVPFGQILVLYFLAMPSTLKPSDVV